MSRVDGKAFEYIEDYGKAPPFAPRILKSPPLALLVHALLVGSWLLVPLLNPESDLPPTPTITVLLAPTPRKPPEPEPPPLPPAPPGRPLGTIEGVATVNLPRLPPFLSEVRIPIDSRQVMTDLSFGLGSIELPPGLGEIGGSPGGIQGGVPGGIPRSTGSAEAARAEPVRIAPNSPQAVPIAKVDPIYPEPALKARVQGVVVVDVIVGPEGEPENLRLVRSQALLDQAALEAVRQWRWSPFVVEGRPVPFKVLVTVQFQIAAKG